MSDRELAVIVPTRGRPGNINRVLDAWDATNAWDYADLILAVDEDDPEFYRYRRLLAGGGDGLFVTSYSRWQPMVSKLNQTAVRVANYSEYRAVGFAGDDHIPRTDGWARAYLETLKELGTGMVYGDDGLRGVELSTEWAVTSNAVRALGRMVPAQVDHLYCDNAMMDLYGSAMMLVHLPGVRIEHMHPVAGKARDDAQYRRVNSPDQYAADGAAYARWKQHVLPHQVQTLVKLKEEQHGK